MSLEQLGIVVAIVGGILSIIGNAIAITWSFAKLSAKLDNWIVSFARFEEGYKDNKVRIEQHIDALWKKHDAMNDKVVTLEANK